MWILWPGVGVSRRLLEQPDKLRDPSRARHLGVRAIGQTVLWVVVVDAQLSQRVLHGHGIRRLRILAMSDDSISTFPILGLLMTEKCGLVWPRSLDIVCK